ncbi:MAG: 3-oxoacyl-ACP reductase FabG [Peptococcaceae bacterium]|nr:3-oxoacyl-ACP reductase FabG [Peptococcaceae bacterium]
MKLKDKIAVITGGSQGIGKAIAEEFSNEGAHVIIVNRTAEKGQETVRELTSKGGKASSIPADVSLMDDVEKLVERIKKEFARIDILVNNAGIIRPAMLHKMKCTQWDEVLRINLTGYFYCINQFANLMLSQNYGRIINISSVAGQRGTIGQINYGAAKAGVHGLTKSAAKELARYGITVNAIAAGLFRTDMSDRIPQDIKEKSIKEIPLGRMGEPWEIARLAIFLASDDAAYITGQIIGINGGVYM